MTADRPAQRASRPQPITSPGYSRVRASNRRPAPRVISSRSRSAAVPSLGPAQELVLEGPDGADVKGKLKSDFIPMSLGIGATVDHVPIVFAGYGITAKDDDLKLDYDDYAGIDVQGKAVLLIRREPQQRDDASRFDGKRTTRYATFQHKATNAFQHGAVAVLLVNDEAGLGGEKDALLPFGSGGAPTSIPTFRS